MILLHNSFFSLFSCVISSTFINFGWRLKFIIQQLATILELLHKIEKKKIFVCIWEWAQLYTNVAQINVFIFNKMLLRNFFQQFFHIEQNKICLFLPSCLFSLRKTEISQKRICHSFLKYAVFVVVDFFKSVALSVFLLKFTGILF